MPDPRPEVSLAPVEGWHCGHYFYRLDRRAVAALSPAAVKEAAASLAGVLSASGLERLQTYIIAGHKADFGWMGLGPNPLALHGVHQRLLSSPLGPLLQPAWSFVSLTEVSEYLPTAERYAERLAAEGVAADTPAHQEQLAAYTRRLEVMRRQRLTPDLPNWPAFCFYPMNKRRAATDNWFLLDFDRRERLMAEHGASGMSFAGKVTQLVTVGIGLDDWEWGVSLWARNPQFLTAIVYRMRFDEASARYGEFGPFYSGYQATADEVVRHCGLA